MSQEKQARLQGLQQQLASLLPATQPACRAEAASVMLDMAQTLDELDMADEEHQLLLQLIEEFEDDRNPEVLLSVCAAIRSAAVNHYRRDELYEAQHLVDQLRQHAEHPDSRVRRHVVRGLLSHSGYLSDQNQHAAELTVYDNVITLFSDDPAPAVRELVASAMFDKAVTHDQAGDPAAENATYEALIELMGSEGNESILLHVCKAHVNLLFNMQREGEHQDALEHCAAVVELVGERSHAGLEDQLARALFGAARIHDTLGDHRREQAALDQLVQRLETSQFPVSRVNLAQALNRKGRGLDADFNDPQAAVRCYRNIVDRFGDTPLLYDGDPADRAARQQHVALVRQVARALMQAAEAYCGMKEFEAARGLILGLRQTYGQSDDIDTREILAEARELASQIERLSGRKNDLKDLFVTVIGGGSKLHH